MWIRLRPDIAWSDLFIAAGYCFAPRRAEEMSSKVGAAWSGDAADRILITLSVRSAFDLALRALKFPPGSEVMLSALTVPGMVDIVRSHGLTPVPVDVDQAGHVCLQSLKNAINPATKMLVVAHLFGGRAPLDDVLQVTSPNGIFLVEDSAQGFARVGDRGHCKSDLVLHSFGPIKTATALGGAVARVASTELHQQMSAILSQDPWQTRVAFMRRLLRFMVLKSLAGQWASGAFCLLLRCLGFDVDSQINSIGRGFSSTKLLAQIRRRPSTPLLLLLRRRWRTYDFDRIDRRRRLGRRLDELLGETHDPKHSYWVYPLFLPNAERVREQLRNAGFDATMQSRMIVVPAEEERRAAKMEALFQQMLFLPWYSELSDEAVEQMAELVGRESRDDSR